MDPAGHLEPDLGATSARDCVVNLGGSPSTCRSLTSCSKSARRSVKVTTRSTHVGPLPHGPDRPSSDVQLADCREHSSDDVLRAPASIAILVAHSTQIYSTSMPSSFVTSWMRTAAAPPGRSPVQPQQGLPRGRRGGLLRWHHGGSGVW